MRTRKRVALLVVGAMAITMLGAGLASAAGHPTLAAANAQFSGSGKVIGTPASCNTNYVTEVAKVTWTQTGATPTALNGKVVVTEKATLNTVTGILYGAGTFKLLKSGKVALKGPITEVGQATDATHTFLRGFVNAPFYNTSTGKPTAKRLVANVEALITLTGVSTFSFAGDYGITDSPGTPAPDTATVWNGQTC